MTEWDWEGARWWKFDFHTHTPASFDYGKGPDQQNLKKRSPREWLLDYMRAGIDCIAITDHNSGAWVDLLKDAFADLERKSPDDFRPIYLFPAMEISVHGGIHLLAIFDSSKTTSDMDALRGAVGSEGKPGENSYVTSKSFMEVVKAIVSMGGIAIPAHVDEDNGLFLHSGTTLEQELACDEVFAMELVNPDFQKPQLYINKTQYWTEVVGSDAHHPRGGTGQRYPGSRYTWVKMASPSIEGLRLALLDGSLSVRRSDKVAGSQNEHAPLVMEEIEISKARYMGRGESFTLRFNPWLNAIIGGRGTGKSTLIEFLRLALRRDNELPDDLKTEFEKYSRVSTSREDGGLLTNETRIAVTYRKNGSRFLVQWSPAGELDSIQEEIDGSWKHAEGEVRQRFPVQIYSQKQIFHLARAPLALLKVVVQAWA